MENEKDEKKDFTTPDLYLAAAVSLQIKTLPEYRVDEGIVVFCFPKSPPLLEAVVSFNNGIKLNAYELSFRIKRIRSDMLIRKNQLKEKTPW